MTTPRIAVIGAGSFGKNHLRVVHQAEHATLAGVLDPDPARTAAAVDAYACPVFSSLDQLAGAADAAIIATPTTTHTEIGCALMQLGLDVLVEKPIAHDLASARLLNEVAERTGRILMVGHLERFNPAVTALTKVVTRPLFFEVHRMSEFTPRSLDVDVVLDLMIHDLDIVLTLTGTMPEEIRAAGIQILSQNVDIANVRLQFPGGCIANLTASRVSTERIRKLRLFQPHEYISLDYSRQDGVRISVDGNQKMGLAPLSVTKDEPLRIELEEFFDAVRTRRTPAVTGRQALAALEVARGILDRIEEHARIVAQTIHVPGTPV